jgi:hypothetical protein
MSEWRKSGGEQLFEFFGALGKTAIGCWGGHGGHAYLGDPWSDRRRAAQAGIQTRKDP